ncbi:MAG: SAM-dependent methyltransferase [Holophaga sp.]|nr:SAM-dependent methyltransferase [Holophaga sp.]
MRAIETIIKSRLAAGIIPAAEVMALALYHPEHGYYRRAEGPWGFEGKDYYTALDCGPLLGQTLALRLEKAWETMGCPKHFTVLEPGAGRGWLGRDLLTSIQGAFAEAFRYVHMDDNPAARRAAESALMPWIASGRAGFVGESQILQPFVGAILSNELFDAVPAQPWRWNGTAWEREMLGTEGPRWEPAMPGEAGVWFDAQSEGALEVGDGSVWVEALPELVHKFAGYIEQGLFLTIDYGDSAARLLAKGADLRRYKAHSVDGKWWEDLGTSDLTADVDFTRLATLLSREGFQLPTHQSLGRWVREHAPLIEWEAQWQELAGPVRMARMENLLALTLPGMMGDRFKVLEAWRR